jgi:TolB-like protein
LRWALIVSALIVFAAARAWRGQDSSTPLLPALPPGAAVTDSKLASAPRLSIVVLPFANLSGDPEQDTLADGLTADLTTDLTRLPDSFVIGRSPATAYKGKRMDLRRLGRHLGVRYALEGSVRRAGETITVNAQLISTEEHSGMAAQGRISRSFHRRYLRMRIFRELVRPRMGTVSAA